MASGLFALLDDVAAIAKVAAASLDDVTAQAAKAGAKAAGVVIDDTAVTPRYAMGFAAERELPIIGRIALGSLRNKLLLLPLVLVVGAVLPEAITPLLMAGGTYLCVEGAGKVLDLVRPAWPGTGSATAPPARPQALEEQSVRGAIRTDLVLSAEIMVIALASIEAQDLLTRALALAAAGVAITAGVYGAVALIVKADDIGAALARRYGGWRRAAGRALVRGMPWALAVLSVLGLLAMLWVGGGFVIHGLAEFGWPGLQQLIEAVAQGASSLEVVMAPVLGWLAQASLSAVLGLGLGTGLVATWRLGRRG